MSNIIRFYAISDLHLSLTVNKPMDIFGTEWTGHVEKIRENLDALVRPEDVVLLPGDHSWALRKDEALPDLEFLAKRPGTKILIRGNHDYWWHRRDTNKLRRSVDSSIVLLHRTSVPFLILRHQSEAPMPKHECEFDAAIAAIVKTDKNTAHFRIRHISFS